MNTPSDSNSVRIKLQNVFRDWTSWLTVRGLVFSIFGMMTLFLSVLFLFFVVNFDKTVKLESGKALDEFAAYAQNVFSDTVDRFVIAPETIAQDQSIQQVVNDPSVSVDISTPIIRQKTNFHFEMAFLISESGRLLFSDTQDSSVLINSNFEQAIGRSHQIKTLQIIVVDSPIYQKPVLLLILPILGAERNGVIVYGKVLDEEFLKSLFPDEKKGVFVFTDSGEIGSSNIKNISAFQSGLVASVGKRYSANDEHLIEDISMGDMSGSIHIASLFSERHSFIKGGFFLDTTDFYVLQRNLTEASVFFFGAFLLLFGVVFLIIRYAFLAPLRGIVSGLSKMSQGELTARIGAFGTQELREISFHFNMMAEKLGKSHRELEGKVKERTAALLIKTEETEKKNIELIERGKALANVLEDARILESNLKESNTLIEKQKERAESILRYLKSIGESVFVTDVFGKIIFMNEPAEIMTGTKLKQAEGKASFDIIPFIREKKNENDVMRLAEKTLNKGATVSFSHNTFLVQSNGERIPVAGTCSLILDMDNEVIGTITVFRDITKLRELDQMKDNFLSVAAHQLRTPLGSMRWSMELLMSGDLGKLSKDVKDAIKQIYDNSGRMITLVNDLLDVSRIDSERGQEAKKPIDIISLIKEVIDAMQSEAKKRSVKIIFTSPEGSVPALMAPPKHLYEALENLVSNGIKYNRENGTLTISVELTKEAIFLTVADTGIGIPVEDRNKVFSKFFRAQNAVLKETEGSGLGLSVVKSYLEEAHATISYESEESVGTEFFITFPLHPVAS